MRRPARLEELAARLPAGAISTDPAVLAERGRDWWALAFLRERRGDHAAPPAAVAFPTTTDEVSTILAWSAETETSVVPRGLGSGVCGGAQPDAGWLVLDLSRMDRVLEVDEVSRIVSVEAGVRGDRLEAGLEPHGLTVGHYPQSMTISSVGGWIAAASAGQASAGYGAIEARLLGLTAVLAGGEVMRLKPVPRSAAGPDLRRLLVGSEGTLAVVTEAHLACSSLPSGWVWDAFRFDSFARCMDALRGAIRSEAGAFVMRGYDEVDSTLNFGRLGHTDGCVALVGFSADLPGLSERRTAAGGAAVSAGGAVADPGYGEHWWEHRNDAVETYRRIMGPERSFGEGVVVDTMEVAGVWRSLPDLYTSVRSALAGTAEVVGCHLSHVYPSGSSLYFTFMVRGANDRQAEDRYLDAWDHALQACLAEGGTIAHHHGVGRLKAPFLEGELGPGGVGVLRQLKRAMDPRGLLNPGTLLP